MLKRRGKKKGKRIQDKIKSKKEEKGKERENGSEGNGKEAKSRKETKRKQERKKLILLALALRYTGVFFGHIIHHIYDERQETKRDPSHNSKMLLTTTWKKTKKPVRTNSFCSFSYKLFFLSFLLFSFYLPT